ncbi:MAG: hypothetical protein WED09_03290 [Homoserinimonas sp.]
MRSIAAWPVASALVDCGDGALPSGNDSVADPPDCFDYFLGRRTCGVKLQPQTADCHRDVSRCKCRLAPQSACQVVNFHHLRMGAHELLKKFKLAQREVNLRSADVHSMLSKVETNHPAGQDFRFRLEKRDRAGDGSSQSLGSDRKVNDSPRAQLEAQADGLIVCPGRTADHDHSLAE